jgi:D-beta-D-heptose 7-phosphate kinase/D-beta-D-heptose 1-phosphate adenosyltransferase
MNPRDLLQIIDSLGHPRVLVVGDLILDRYTWGNAERVSQEAPVILLRADQREVRAGGAANVCMMLRGLEAEVCCAGVVGDDPDGQVVVELLSQAGVDTAAVVSDTARPTTTKERFIGRAANRHPHQILRVDSEVREPIAGTIEQLIIERLLPRIGTFHVVLISDYHKGVCTPRVLRTLIQAARDAGVPVIVDPARGADYSVYRGATTMTPNRVEAELATGTRIVTANDAFAAGETLCRQLALDMAIITLDRDGMALVWPQAIPGGRPSGEMFPTRARAVYDITGAGDMVLSMIGVALAAGTSVATAIELGNIAAGLEVERLGVAVIRRDEIRAAILASEAAAGTKVVTLDELVPLVAAHRMRGEKIVLTNGCFDLLHVGHVSYLQEAATLGDRLIVAVNSDAGVRRLKGPTRPIIGENDRAAMLAALAVVDYVLIFDEDTPHEILRRIRPDVLVKGGTYTTEQVVGHEIVEAYGGRVCVTGVVEGISTTAIVNSLADRRVIRPPHFQLAVKQPETQGSSVR